jgi:hypothetical protein
MPSMKIIWTEEIGKGAEHRLCLKSRRPCKVTIFIGFRPPLVLAAVVTLASCCRLESPYRCYTTLSKYVSKKSSDQGRRCTVTFLVRAGVHQQCYARI